MILLIDNYDSFTYNVAQALSRLSGEEVRTVRNDALDLEDIEALAPSRIVISPGPGRPEEAGISVAAIRRFAGRIPILGICLGHQAIGYAFGGKVVQAKRIRHGEAEPIALDGRGLFRTIGTSAVFTRYHSLAVSEQDLPAELEVSARSSDGDIMGLRHRKYLVEGVQFHPESIASEAGDSLFRSFLNYRLEPFDYRGTLNRVVSGADLDRDASEAFMEELTEGTLGVPAVAGLLAAIAAKGPAAEEIAGCAAVLRRKKTPLPASVDAVDTCGTGGDGVGTFNISSMAALVAAACGLPVAKHGNRAVSSKSGSADFYEALGLPLGQAPAAAAQSLARTNFAFLFAPTYHGAMRHAAPARSALGIKTIMNLVGPLSNPADAKWQVIGVYDESLLLPVAEAARMLGVERVLTVRSRDGMDEISPCAPTDCVEIGPDGSPRTFVFDPAGTGYAAGSFSELLGGDGAANARLAEELAAGGGRSALAAATALNAGAALYVAGRAASIQDGARAARDALRSGAVSSKIEELRAFRCA